MESVTKLSRRTTITIFMLGIAGQIAWAIENNWFNLFVYDEISKNTDVVAWMTAVSAATATITSLIMGTLSDHTRTKMGRRKPYLFYGYTIWGLVTALFPTVAYIEIIGIALVMVVIMDSVMTFFGSTANDAAFNAWITDISDSSNRARIQGLLSVGTLLGNLIAIGAAGIVIQTYGYYVFFYILGGFVTFVGLLFGSLVQEPPLDSITIKAPTVKEVFVDLYSSFRPDYLKANRTLFLLFGYMCILGIGSQVASPYLFIYLEENMGFDETTISVVAVIVIGIAALCTIAISLVAHKLNRHTTLLFCTIGGFIGFLSFTQSHTIPTIAVSYAIQLSFSMAGGVIMGAWMQDLYPEENRGKFQGFRMIFFVAIPMIIGPMIGSYIIHTYGIKIIENNILTGYIPTSEIFIGAGIIALFALIPLFFIPKAAGKIVFKKQDQK